MEQPELTPTLPRVNDGRIEEYSNDKIMRKIDEIRSIQGHLNQAIGGLKLLLLFVEHHEESEVQKMIDRLMADKEVLKRLKYSENTGVVSSAESESSVYTDVGESNTSGDTEQPQALVEGALEKITEYGNNCPSRLGSGKIYNGTNDCINCGGTGQL